MSILLKYSILISLDWSCLSTKEAGLVLRAVNRPEGKSVTRTPRGCLPAQPRACPPHRHELPTHVPRVHSTAVTCPFRVLCVVSLGSLCGCSKKPAFRQVQHYPLHTDELTTSPTHVGPGGPSYARLACRRLPWETRGRTHSLPRRADCWTCERSRWFEPVVTQVPFFLVS